MPFFTQANDLAKLFTPPIWAADKYLPSGCKPIEEFVTDIRNNMFLWAAEGDIVCYKTNNNWYAFQMIREGSMKGVVTMSRFNYGSWQRIDTWANPSSIACIGREWLATKKDKRVALFG